MYFGLYQSARVNIVLGFVSNVALTNGSVIVVCEPKKNLNNNIHM